MTESKPTVFEVDNGRTTITGYLIAEVRGNGVALLMIGCDRPNCHALHLHLIAEEEDGRLWLVTTLDAVDNDAVMRSGILYRALSKLLFDNYDVKNVMPGAVEHEEKWDGTEIIPGLTKWGRG